MLESQIYEYLQHFKEKPPKPTLCEICRRHNGLRWHGSYMRNLIAAAKTYSIPIRRLFCTFCCHSFALLPSFIAKFHRYAKDVIRTALSWLKSHTYEATLDFLVNRLMSAQEHSLAIVTLHLWRRKFHQTRRT